MNKRFFCSLIIAVTASLVLQLGAPSYSLEETLAAPGTRLDVNVGSMRRTAFVHIPAGYGGGKAYPVVVVFHGGGDDAAKIADVTGFNDLSDKNEFIVVYPEGVNHRWNDGRKISGLDESLLSDDVSFTMELLTQVSKNWSINHSRVYAVGFSNGGLFCQRLGIELGGSFAAIAPVSASMSEDECKPARDLIPVSVVMFFGKDDPIEPWSGGDVRFGGKSLGRIAPVQDVVNFWIQTDGCDRKPQRLEVSADKSTPVVSERYANNKSGDEVLLYVIEGGGHTWPGTKYEASESAFGKTCHGINASQLIWEFLSQHSKS